MDRAYYLKLAENGTRMAIATHLVLHDHADHEEILRDGQRLGALLSEAATYFNSPLAMPVMDLTMEKEALLLAYGIAEADIDTYHFREDPGPDWDIPLTERQKVTCEALAYVAKEGKYISTGMGIGPF